MLEIRNLEVCYGSISALQGISAKVESGSIVTLVGANGAGKTTTLRTISGVVKAKSGTITFDGEEITNKPPHKIVARGIAQCPEGRMVFANLTVMENLRMGAYLRRDKAGIVKDLEYVFGIFPRLHEREKQTRWNAQRRRAADAGHRQGVDEQTEVPHARRAIAWNCSDPRAHYL